jgi:hypothetical protein
MLYNKTAGVWVGTGKNFQARSQNGEKLRHVSHRKTLSLEGFS